MKAKSTRGGRMKVVPIRAAADAPVKDVDEGARARATITQKAPGVVFGLDVAGEVFRQTGTGGLVALAAEGEWRDGVPAAVAPPCSTVGVTVSTSRARSVAVARQANTETAPSTTRARVIHSPRRDRVGSSSRRRDASSFFRSLTVGHSEDVGSC